MDANRRRRRLTVLALVAFVALVFFWTLYRFAASAAPDAAELAARGLYLLDKPRQVGGFRLQDHRGQPFTPARLQGGWHLLFFGYSRCPDICPITLSVFRQLRDLLESSNPALLEQLRFGLVSVDPEWDSPERLARYVGAFHPDFIGVTGEPPQVLSLATQLAVVYQKVPRSEGDYLVDHSGNIVLVDPAGRYHGFFRPPFEPERLAENLAGAHRLYGLKRRKDLYR